MPQCFNIHNYVNNNLIYMFMEVNPYFFIHKSLYKANNPLM